MIQASEPINIMDMVDQKEIDRKAKEKKALNLGIVLIKKMKEEGSTDKEIEKQIHAIELPLSVHMALLGRYSEILKYGRILSKQERKLFHV